MDIVLEACDHYFFSPYIYPESWPEGYCVRQILNLYVITVVSGWSLYMIQATFSYFFIFDRRLEKHPQFLENQSRLEILYASKSIPFMALFTVPLFFLEVRGYSRLYMGISGVAEWSFVALSAVSFLMFTDCLIYWIHKGLHNRLAYKYIHKPHHKWKVPTPFASHAFHPVDGFLQSLPYHIYPFIFPLHKLAYLVLFIFVNIWTVSIHDGDYRVPDFLRPFVNGAAHHTDHHLFYSCNYGQFFTLWDHIGGSFKNPSAFEGKLLIKDVQEGGNKVKDS